MSVVRNYVPNPTFESAATGLTQVPGTSGTAAVTAPTQTTAFGTKVGRTQWSVASTAAGGGCYLEVDIATVGLVVGDVISAGYFHVRSSIANRLVMSVEFRTNVGTISTSTNSTPKQVGAGTVYTAALAASVDGSFKLENLTIPATCTKIRIRLLSVAGTGYANWSIGSQLDIDAVMLNKGATLQNYVDGTLGNHYAWAGTAHASVSGFYTPEILLTPIDDASPCPRIVVLVNDIPPAVTTIELTRLASRRRQQVRGAVHAVVSGTFQTNDVEAPFNVESTYRLQMFVDTVDAGYSDTATTTLECNRSWIHNVLDPWGATQIDVDVQSGFRLTRYSDGEQHRAERRVLGVLLSGQRHGLEGVPLMLTTLTLDDADRFQDMIGTYDDADEGDGNRIPILCVRTPAPYDRLPRPFFASVLKATELPRDVHFGGQYIEHEVQADEIAPPFPGIVVPLLTRADIDAFFPTRAALNAAYGRRVDIDRDYAKAGTA